ncbi:hypothetical protein [Amaricoccus macauensis]|uniref:hypothetical protein n=1 Tax=Amaricoccus macauensis TaxID=57001 RepID=UPI003C7DEE3C
MEKIACLVIGAALAVVVMTLLPVVRMQAGMGADMAVATEGAGAGMSEITAMHQHPPREISPDLPEPGLTHLMFPDAMDGYSIQILPRNFTFTPAGINRVPVFNEGHAHVYVNGAKVARVYAPWFHLPGAALRPGRNEVTVTLNANDHGEWSRNGVPISSTVQVQGPLASR